MQNVIISEIDKFVFQVFISFLYYRCPWTAKSLSVKLASIMIWENWQKWLRQLPHRTILWLTTKSNRKTMHHSHLQHGKCFAEYGKFHYFLLAVCGFVSTSEEMDVISMSFILPSAQCDLHLNTAKKGWLNSIIFIGMMVGAYAWGSIADSLGRRKVLITISFMNALCIVASSFSQSYTLFMVFRFLNGAA